MLKFECGEIWATAPFLYREDFLSKGYRGAGIGKAGKPQVLTIDYSDAASGWAGWALAHPEFGISVNPITTRGADYAHHITASPPGFENPVASLYSY